MVILWIELNSYTMFYHLGHYCPKQTNKDVPPLSTCLLFTFHDSAGRHTSIVSRP